MKNTADTNGDNSITYDDALPWQEAIDYCAGLGNGWRLPTYTELESLVDYGRINPAINPVFTCESSNYWSATTDAYSTDDAWDVDFYNGNNYYYYKTDYSYVRCVRGGL